MTWVAPESFPLKSRTRGGATCTFTPAPAHGKRQTANGKRQTANGTTAANTRGASFAVARARAPHPRRL
jgi:hypothetical protein